MRLHTLGKTVRQFVCWSIGNVLHPHENHLPFTPVLTTRIITALPLLDVIVVFLQRRRRPVCNRWACLVPTTQYTLHSAVVHAFLVITKNITKIRTRATVYYIICHKMFANMLPKKGNWSIFFHRNLFQRKKGQKSAKRPNEKANQLEIKIKKAKRPTKIC